MTSSFARVSTGCAIHDPEAVASPPLFMGYEGLVAKDEASPYESGRTTRWLKGEAEGLDRRRGRLAAADQHGAVARAEGEMNDAEPPLDPWFRINRVLRVMLHTHWSAEARAQVRVEFRKALALSLREGRAIPS